MQTRYLLLLDVQTRYGKYVYMYIYMYTCIYICIHIYTYMYAYTYTEELKCIFSIKASHLNVFSINLNPL